MLTALTTLNARVRFCGAVAAASGVLGLLASFAPHGAIRFAALGIFVLVGPGAALVGLWEVDGDWISWVVVAMTLSLSICCVIASIMLWIAWWHPAGGLAVLAALTICGGLVGVVRELVGRAR